MDMHLNMVAPTRPWFVAERPGPLVALLSAFICKKGAAAQLAKPYFAPVQHIT